MEPVIPWPENVFVQEKWELRKIKKDKHAVCIVSCALMIAGAEGFTVKPGHAFASGLYWWIHHLKNISFSLLQSQIHIFILANVILEQGPYISLY